MIDDKSLYKYTQANVLENENFTLYWNRSILTEEIISFNRPDITFMNKETKKNFLTRARAHTHTHTHTHTQTQTQKNTHTQHTHPHTNTQKRNCTFGNHILLYALRFGP